MLVQFILVEALIWSFNSTRIVLVIFLILSLSRSLFPRQNLFRSLNDHLYSHGFGVEKAKMREREKIIRNFSRKFGYVQFVFGIRERDTYVS